MVCMDDDWYPMFVNVPRKREAQRLEAAIIGVFSSPVLDIRMFDVGDQICCFGLSIR